MHQGVDKEGRLFTGAEVLTQLAQDTAGLRAAGWIGGGDGEGTTDVEDEPDMFWDRDEDLDAAEALFDRTMLH
jgi:hypothetical protein